MRYLQPDGSISPEGLARAVSERHGIELIDLSLFKVDFTASNLIDPAAAKRYESLPIAKVNDREAAEAMLVVGSSLMVYSGFRFARMAKERGLPLAVLNRGRTRADALVDLKLEGECGAVLAAAFERG